MELMNFFVGRCHFDPPLNCKGREREIKKNEREKKKERRETENEQNCVRQKERTLPVHDQLKVMPAKISDSLTLFSRQQAKKNVAQTCTQKLSHFLITSSALFVPFPLFTGVKKQQQQQK